MMNLFYFIENKKESSFLTLCFYSFFVIGFISATYLLIKGDATFSWIGLGFLLNSFIGLCMSTILICYDLKGYNKFGMTIIDVPLRRGRGYLLFNFLKYRFSEFKWSTLYFSLMATVYFSQIIFTNQLSNLVVNAYFSIAVAPFILISIYYQWRIIKYWNPLYVIIQLVSVMNSLLGFILISSDVIEIPIIEDYNMAIISSVGLLLFIIFAISILKNTHKSYSP